MALPLLSVIFRLEQLVPLRYAEAWDNPGLLVEARPQAVIRRMLLTIDLTEQVLAEAASMGADMILAYHPPLFKAIRQLTRQSATGRVVLDAIAHGISIYSVHTALDAATGGINDWLAGAIGDGTTAPIVPISGAEVGVGMGRRIELAKPTTLDRAIERIKSYLALEGLRVAATPAHSGGATISSMAVCAGAGGSVFEQLDHADLLLTGEMRHHDILARLAAGTSVILTDHTHTERGYLQTFAGKLRRVLEDVEVRISEVDREPLEIS